MHICVCVSCKMYFWNVNQILHTSGNIMISISLQVDMTKVRLEVIKPWVTEKITTILGIEDDVVIEYVFNQLEAEKVSC